MKKQKNATRIIAIVLVALMALALVPIAASAEVTPAPVGSDITWTYNGNGGKTSTDETVVVQDLKAGEAFDVLTNPFTLEHYSFSGWKRTSPTGEGFTDDWASGQHVDGGSLYNSELDAQWTEDPKYTVNFDANYEGAPALDSVTDYQGEEVPLPAISRNGYRLDGWSETATGPASYKENAPYYMTAETNKTLFAVWVETVTVTYDVNGGSAVIPPVTKDKGQSFELPSPGTKTGYKFMYWLDGTIIRTGDSFTPDSSTTVVAQWDKDWVNLTYKPGTGASGSDQADQRLRGTTYSLIEMPSSWTVKSGKKFDQWLVDQDGSLQPPGDFTWPAGNYSSLTMTAQWKNLFKVTFHNNDGTGTTTTKEVEEDTQIGTLPAPTRDKYTLDGWYDNPGLSGTPVSDTKIVDQPMDLYAKWKYNYVDVTFDPGTGGTGTMDKAEALLGGKYAMPANGFTPKSSDYTFMGWKVNGSEKVYAVNEEYDVPEDSGGLTLVAQWADTSVKVKLYFEGVTMTHPEYNPVTQTMSRATAGTLEGYTLIKSQLGITEPDNMYFAGWKKAGAEAVQFTNMESVCWNATDPTAKNYIDDTNEVTLYAVWEENLVGTIAFTKDGAAVTTATTFKVGDEVKATATITKPNPAPIRLRYTWERPVGEGEYVVVAAGTTTDKSSTYAVTADDLGKTLLVTYSSTLNENSKISDTVEIKPDESETVTVTFLVTGKEASDSVKVNGAALSFDSEGKATSPVVKGGKATIELAPGSGRKVSSVKRDDVEQEIMGTYTWTFTKAETIKISFDSSAHTGTPKAVVDPNASVPVDAKNEVMNKAKSPDGKKVYPYTVKEVVACWDGNVTDKLTPAELAAAIPLDIETFPYPEGSGTVNGKDISGSMTAYYTATAWHYNTTSKTLTQVPDAKVQAQKTFAAGVKILGQSDFSPYGVVLTPTNLEGSITFSGLKEGKAAVGSPVTATFTSTKTVDGKNVPVVGTLSYQWQFKDGSDWKNISGATANSYTPTAAYRGSNLRVVISSDFETGNVESGEFMVTEKPSPTLNRYIINDGSEQTGVIGNVTSDMQYTLNSSTPGTSGWSNVSGTTIANLTESGRYWVRFKNDSTTANWAYVDVPSYYTVTARPDSVSGNRLTFDATGDAIKYKDNVWLVSSGKSITVNAYSTDTRYYKLTKLTSQMSYSPYTTSSKSFSNANSGSITISMKPSPYVVYGSAGVYGSKTGDYSHLDLWMELACISLMGLCAAVVIGRKKLKKQ